MSLTVEISGLAPGSQLLAPLGMTTPHEAVTGLRVDGGVIVEALTEPELALTACVIDAQAADLRIDYAVGATPVGTGYPEAAFAARETRFSRPSDELAAASAAVATRAGGGRAGIEALIRETEARFVYGHPKRPFNAGMDAVPYLEPGATPGNCVDINTYLMASLRAAGYEAAYVYGYFFPEERGGITHEMHCWVATRNTGEVLEWDIAHHMKAQLGPSRPALNPRGGQRVALGHSMGHRYAAAGVPDSLKLLSEPMRIAPGPITRLPLIARHVVMAAAHTTQGMRKAGS